MKFIDPRIDFAFKKIFGSEDTKDILISFLESLMGLKGDKRIREITILDPYLLPKVRELKTSVLDVKCTDLRGIHYIVEMQVRKVRAFLKRIQYNAAKTYSNQITTAEDYPRLNQVIAVTITDFTLFDEIPHYVSCHLTTEKETNKNFLSEIIYYFIELSKFDKRPDETAAVLDKWIYFIKTAGSLEDVPEGFQEEPFFRAFEKARVVNMDREEFELYDKACMAVADARGAIELALEEGMAAGVKKGASVLLQKLLEKCFGPLPEWACNYLAEAEPEKLDEWALKIYEISDLKDIFQ